MKNFSTHKGFISYKNTFSYKRLLIKIHHCRIRLLKHNNLCKGFTLIELLVVISIIGIILGFTAFNFLEGRRLSRDSSRKVDIKNLKSAFEQYRSDTSYYPYFTSADFSTAFWNTPSNLTGGIDSTNSPGKQMGLTSPIRFMEVAKIPNDPDFSCRYLYYHDASKLQYTLFAMLENPNDQDALLSKKIPRGPNAATPGNCLGSVVSGECARFKISSGVCNGTTYNYWENENY